MQTQSSSISSLLSFLSSTPSILHKKSQTILQTILKTLHSQLSTQSQDNTHLIILTLLYKQYKLSAQSQNLQNSTSYLLLINHFLPLVNTESLESAGVLSNMKDLTVKMLGLSNKNLLAFRYCVSVLTELVLCSQGQKTEYNMEVVQILLGMVLKSNKNVERKEAAKNLKLILDKYPTIGQPLGQLTKSTIQSSQSTHIYINSLKSIIGFYPVTLLNDICYLLRPLLRVQQDNYNQQSTVQAYFFLDSVMDMQLITGDISQQLLKQLIHNIPLGGDNRMMYGYLQCIHQSFITLNRANQKTSQKYISSVVSVVSEMLLSTGKIPKQAEGILKSIISVGVNEGLWRKNGDEFDLGDLEIDDGESSRFGKLIAMLQDLLTGRYDDKRLFTFNVLREFFQRIDGTAYELVENFVGEIIRERSRFQLGDFNQLFGTIIDSIGHQIIFTILPLTITGDPTSQQFQSVNNLWLLEILSKNSSPGSFQHFIDIIFPLLQQTHSLRMDPQQNRLRQAIYHELNHKLWGTLANMYEKEIRYTNWQPCIEYIESNIVDKHEQLPLVLNGLIQLLIHETVSTSYFGSKAEKFIPTLAKILDLENQKQSGNILTAIKNLARVCNQEYLERVFLKNLTKLLGEKEANTLIENESTNSKNIEILIAISYGINFRNQSPIPILTQKLSKLSGIILFLRNFIIQKNIFQKKAYKFMLQCFQFMPQQYMYQVKDLIDSTHQIIPSSRSYRLGVLHALWNNHKYSDQNCNIQNAMAFIKEYLPQIMLMLKEPNQKVRKLAHSMLSKILKTMNNFGIIESFLEMMSAGLASVSAAGKIDTINALTLSLSSLDVYVNGEFAQQLTDVVIVLLQESKPDILKAVINYLKKYIFLFPSSKASLPEIMKGIFESDEGSRLHILYLIKRLLLKLVKRDSKDSIMKIIPAEHQRLLKSLMKEQGKKKRVQRRKEYFRREAENKKGDDSSDSQDDIPKHGTNMGEMQVQETPIDRNKVKNNLLLKYDLDEEKFHFVDGKTKPSKSSKKKDQQAEQDDIAFIDGKLIIKQSVIGKKRRDEQPQQEEDEKQDNNRYNSKKAVKLSDTSALHQIKESGSSYKAARAHGDLRVKNKPEPHAFIQLNPKALNKRYKQKADKVFEEFFEKRQGGLKGLKAKIVKRK